MHEVKDTNPLSPAADPARVLTNDYLRSYAIEDHNQTNAYARLARLVEQIDNEDGLVLSVTPGYYDDEDIYTITITASL